MFITIRNNSINTDKISYIKEVDEKFFLEYRKKASIKSVEIDFGITSFDKHNYFQRHKLYNLNGYWINVKQISFIHEERLDKKTGTDRLLDLTIYFSDGLLIEIEIEESRWRVWKETRLSGI